MGGLQGKPPLKFLLMEYRYMLYNVFKTMLLSVLQVGGEGRRELHGVFLWNVVAVLYEVCRPSSTESSIGWTVVVQMFN